MFSKFLKFVAGTAFLAVIGANGAKADSLTPGLIIGVGGDIMFAINENSDFSYTVPAAVPAGTALTASTPAAPNLFVFNAKKDQGFGGNVSFGYLMENGLEGAIEVGYRDLQYKSSNKSKIETTNLIGMLTGTYYLDIGSMVYPYLKAGVGVVHVNAKGTVNNNDSAKAGADAYVKFIDMKANKLYGEAGVGLAAAMQNALISIGVKVDGNQNMEDSKTYTDMKVADGAAGQFTKNSDFTFGKLSQINYSVEAKIKMIMA